MIFFTSRAATLRIQPQVRKGGDSPTEARTGPCQNTNAGTHCLASAAHKPRPIRIIQSSGFGGRRQRRQPVNFWSGTHSHGVEPKYMMAKTGGQQERQSGEVLYVPILPPHQSWPAGWPGQHATGREASREHRAAFLFLKIWYALARPPYTCGPHRVLGLRTMHFAPW